MAKQSPVLAPRRLFLQIVQLQVFYYLVGLVVISFTLFVMGVPWHAQYVFSWQEVRAETTLGWLLSLLWMLDALFSVLGLAIIVGRSKLATDFALSLHAVNFIVVFAYSRSFPLSWLWWVTQALSALLMVYGGVWASQWRELRKTFFEEYELVDIEREREASETP